MLQVVNTGFVAAQLLASKKYDSCFSTALPTGLQLTQTRRRKLRKNAVNLNYFIYRAKVLYGNTSRFQVDILRLKQRRTDNCQAISLLPGQKF